jgi:hypothetical protein
MITKEEIKQKIELLNRMIEYELELEKVNFTLSNNILTYTNDINYLQKLCGEKQHSFGENDICIYCGRVKEKRR